MRIERYFQIEESAHHESESDTIRHTRALLDHAIDDIAALRPGAMLSGGLDSTALTALLAAQDRRAKTFSVDYRGNETDYRPNAFRPSMDAPYVEIAAQSLHTEHLRFVLEQQELADALTRLRRAASREWRISTVRCGCLPEKLRRTRGMSSPENAATRFSAAIRGSAATRRFRRMRFPGRARSHCAGAYCAAICRGRSICTAMYAPPSARPLRNAASRAKIRAARRD